MLLGVQSQSQFLPDAAGGGIEFIGSETKTGNSGSVTISVPGYAENGDFLVAAVTHGNQEFSSASSGWTFVSELNDDQQSLALAYTVKDDLTTDVTFSGDVFSRKYCAGMCVFRGVDSSDPTDSVSPSKVVNINQPRTAAITPNSSPSLRLCFIALDSVSNNQDIAPAENVQLFSETTAVTPTNGYDVSENSLFAFTRESSDTSEYPSQTISPGINNQGYDSTSIVLKQA